MTKQKCKYCEKEIECVTQEQLDSLMAVHLITKHKDRVEIREIKEERRLKNGIK